MTNLYVGVGLIGVALFTIILILAAGSTGPTAGIT